ncbi:LOW QUALITY PROTEIN: cytochrome P450 6k1-like [Bombus pyrosoma]|uniref:LOW QUALITY PROTEIN: cytochrome P450 6k1-like n=1 Tax=Bombus pyrosoma TaxID=396416 RepID=UPI001CB897B1|nr:LOW QUALITY PROTEIN: cytochrome P450 6k1-like [Bombus pyrosoma]
MRRIYYHSQQCKAHSRNVRYKLRKYFFILLGICYLIALVTVKSSFHSDSLKMALLTLYWSLDGILVLSSLIIAAYLFVTRKFNYWSKRGVKELPPTPFVGNFMDCLLSRKSGSEFLKDLYDYGKGWPLLGFYVFDKPQLLIRDQELVKHVLVKDFDYFPDRYATADEQNDRFGYANVVLMKNQGWKSLRPKLTPMFTPGKLKTMFDSMLIVADDLGKCLDSLHLEGDGKVVEFREISANFTTDMIASIVFGLKVGALKNPKTPFREYGRKIFHPNFHRNMELLIISFSPQLVKYLKPKFFGKNATNFFRSVFWDVIDQRVDSGQKRNDLTDVLIEIRKTYKNNEDLKDYKFDGDDLVAQAIMFFVAGSETSATAIAFTLHELAVNPDVQRTLREEIHDALEKTGGKITYDMITTLPYLDMVISETLRKYPSVAHLDRITVADYEVPNSDLVLEKGTPIFISIMGLHYDSRYFPNPKKYDPLRFTEEAKSTRPSIAYLPFGGGPRGCIGMRLGLIQSKLGIVQILKDYEVSPCEKTKTLVVLDPKTIITTALGGVQLNIRKITTAAD